MNTLLHYYFGCNRCSIYQRSSSVFFPHMYACGIVLSVIIQTCGSNEELCYTRMTGSIWLFSMNLKSIWKVSSEANKKRFESSRFPITWFFQWSQKSISRDPSYINIDASAHDMGSIFPEAIWFDKWIYTTWHAGVYMLQFYINLRNRDGVLMPLMISKFFYAFNKLTASYQVLIRGQSCV